MNSKEREDEGQQLVELSEGTNKGRSLVDSESLIVATSKKLASVLEGVRLIFSSAYLLQICAFLWLTAVISSFFYFEVSDSGNFICLLFKFPIKYLR